MREKGSRICDHAATRDDCLMAWMLPPEVPPPPPAHPNIESFYVYEVERGEPLQVRAVRVRDENAHARPCRLLRLSPRSPRELTASSADVAPAQRHFLTDHQAASVTALDLAVVGAQSRLRTTADWAVLEASSEAPPCLVLGADGDGRRGVGCVFEPMANTWRLLPGVRVPAATLLLAEIVREKVAGSDATVECVHALDAAMVCGDDVRRMPCALAARTATPPSETARPPL